MTAQQMSRPATLPPPYGIRVPRVTVILFGLLLFGVSISKLESDSVSKVGIGAIGLLLLFAALEVFIIRTRQPFPRALTKFLIVGGLFVTFVGVDFLFHPEARGLEVTLQLPFVLTFFMLILLLRWDYPTLQMLAIMTGALIPGYFLLWLATGHHVADTEGLIHSNVVGAYCYHAAIIQIFAMHTARTKGQKMYYIGLVLLALVVLLATHTRTLWISTVVVAGTYALWPHLTKSKARFFLYLFAIMLMIFSAVYLYVHIREIPGYQTLNTFVAQHTGKQLLSGRDRFWGILVRRIMDRPLTGWGPGALPTDFIFNDTLSSHNLYLQVSLQVGLTGLAFLAALIWSLWSVAWSFRDSWYARMLAAFIIGLMFHESFEVTLTQNDMAVGLLQWLVMGVGVSCCAAEYKKAAVWRMLQAQPPPEAQMAPAPDGAVLHPV